MCHHIAICVIIHNSQLIQTHPMLSNAVSQYKELYLDRADVMWANMLSFGPTGMDHMQLNIREIIWMSSKCQGLVIVVLASKDSVFRRAGMQGLEGYVCVWVSECV